MRVGVAALVPAGKHVAHGGAESPKSAPACDHIREGYRRRKCDPTIGDLLRAESQECFGRIERKVIENLCVALEHLNDA